jgi:hypothetical protein
MVYRGVIAVIRIKGKKTGRERKGDGEDEGELS